MNDDRSRLKCLYQQKHFNGVCSYRWNDIENIVEFNPDFYKGKSFPKLITE